MQPTVISSGEIGADSTNNPLFSLYKNWARSDRKRKIIPLRLIFSKGAYDWSLYYRSSNKVPLKYRFPERFCFQPKWEHRYALDGGTL